MSDPCPVSFTRGRVIVADVGEYTPKSAFVLRIWNPNEFSAT